MGCGALLVSDVGWYPDGMLVGKNISSYSSAAEAEELIEHVLDNCDGYSDMEKSGQSMVCSTYSKERQYNKLIRLVKAV